MRFAVPTLIAWLTVAVVAAAASAQPGLAAGKAGELAAPPASQPSGSLLLDRQPVPLTPPSFGTPRRPRPQVEGSEGMLVDARCRFARDAQSGWFILQPLDEAGEPSGSFRVLPSRELEVLEYLAGQNAGTIFHITGQQVFYKHQAYILLQTVMSEADERPPGAAEEAAPADQGPQASGTRRPANLEDIRRSLMKNKPPKPVDMAAAANEQTPIEPGGESQQPGSQSPPGGMIVDRTIRIIPSAEGPWLEAHFVADNNLQDRPLLLLPCRLLEQAERTSGKMRVTGIIRHYRGRDYLLLRKVLPERDMGQL